LVRYASLNFFGLLLLLSLSLTGCKSEDTSADFILQKSLEAHGGRERWKKIKCIRYRKTTTFYDPTGVIEKKSVQHITHQWRPKQTEMIWENKEQSYRALKDTTGISLYKNGVLQKDRLLLAQANTNLKAALYEYWQPFKLLEEKAQKTIWGSKNYWTPFLFMRYKFATRRKKMPTFGLIFLTNKITGFAPHKSFITNASV